MTEQAPTPGTTPETKPPFDVGAFIEELRDFAERTTTDKGEFFVHPTEGRRYAILRNPQVIAWLKGQFLKYPESTTDIIAALSKYCGRFCEAFRPKNMPAESEQLLQKLNLSVEIIALRNLVAELVRECTKPSNQPAQTQQPQAKAVDEVRATVLMAGQTIGAQGRPDYRHNYGDMRDPGSSPLDGSTGLGDVSDSFHGGPQSGPPHNPDNPDDPPKFI